MARLLEARGFSQVTVYPVLGGLMAIHHAIRRLTRRTGRAKAAFTQIVIDRLRELEAVRSVRVEDAPATRSEADYNFISNEIFVEFATTTRQEPIKRFGILPATRTRRARSR